MVDLTQAYRSTIPNKNFEEIYKTLEKYIKSEFSKKDIYTELGRILCFIHTKYPIECDLGISHAQILENIKELKKDIKNLAKTLKNIRTQYLLLEDEEREQSYDLYPEWLSYVTNRFNTNELDELSKYLQNVEKQGKAQLRDKSGKTKKPRLNNFEYYLKNLKKFWEKYTNEKTTVYKSQESPFAQFVLTFLNSGSLGISNM